MSEEEKKVKGRKTGAIKEKMRKVPILRRLTNNTGLKIVSLIFAIILWVVVMTKTNPLRTKVVYDVPVEMTGVNVLNDRGLALANAQDEIPETVDVYLEVPMDDLTRVSVDNVHATLDLSRLNTTGEHSVSVNLSTTYGNTTSSTVSEVLVSIVSLTTSIIPVQVTTTGALGADYRLGKIVATPSQFQITGPETDVNRVVAAVAQVDLNELTSDYNRSVVYTLVDENYVPVDSVHISSSIGNSVTVSMPVYPIVELPITYESSTIGLLEDGFYIDSIEVAPETVRVAAAQSVLDSLTGIPVSTLDLQGVNSSFTTTLSLKTGNDVVWTDVSQVDVVVRVKEMESTKTFRGLPVVYRNLPTGLEADLYNATVDLEVTMARSKLAELTNDDIVVYVDLSGYDVMEDSTVPVQVEINTDAPSNVYSLSTEKVVVKIKKAA